MTYTEEGCCNIVQAAYKKCLKKTEDKKEIDKRINFVENGILFKLWCAVAELDSRSLKNLVIVRNHRFENGKI